MRLSAELFDAADAANGDALRKAVLSASSGRMGLFASDKPFGLSVNINNNMLEVVSLSCTGVTRSGNVVDIDFDSDYTGTLDTRVAIPQGDDDEAYMLMVRLHPQEWRERDDVYSELKYTFGLVGIDSPVDDRSLPVGLVVNQYGWRLDEMEFVPPCLTVRAHPRYAELAGRAREVFREIADRCLGGEECVARHLLAFVWNAALSACIRIDTEGDTLTPGQLFGEVQRVVGSFVVGCRADDAVSLEDPAPFMAYMHRRLDARHLYRDIAAGLSLSAQIAEKVEAVCSMVEAPRQPEPRQAPRPAPRTAPKPEPVQKPSLRRGWEGIEI